MNSPLLSIIIASFNTSKLTQDCLDSIRLDKGLKDIPHEIIVIDNGSSDDSVKMLKKQKNIKLILNHQNKGFAQANNQGIKAAKGNYLLFLNSDTIILHSAISQSLNWLSAHPEAHGCTAQLLNPDKSIQPTGGYFPNLLNIFTWSLGLDDLPLVNKIIKPFHPHPPWFYTRDSFYKSDHSQDWLTGAFFLVRASIVNETQGFDENYFMYGEEMEWQYRMHLKLPNSKLWYLVGPQIIHLGGASALKKSDPLLNEYKGVLAFFKKHRPLWQTKFVKKILQLNALLRGFVSQNHRQLWSKI